MPLMKDILAADFKKDFDLLGKLAKNGNIKTSADAYGELGDRLAMSIEKYVKGGDVVGIHTITALQIAPGPTTLETPPQYTGVQIGKLISPGFAAPGSNIGPFGKGSHPGAKGKII